MQGKITENKKHHISVYDKWRYSRDSRGVGRLQTFTSIWHYWRLRPSHFRHRDSTQIISRKVILWTKHYLLQALQVCLFWQEVFTTHNVPKIDSFKWQTHLISGIKLGWWWILDAHYKSRDDWCIYFGGIVQYVGSIVWSIATADAVGCMLKGKIWQKHLQHQSNQSVFAHVSVSEYIYIYLNGPSRARGGGIKTLTIIIFLCFCFIFVCPIKNIKNVRWHQTVTP